MNINVPFKQLLVNKRGKTGPGGGFQRDDVLERRIENILNKGTMKTGYSRAEREIEKDVRCECLNEESTRAASTEERLFCSK